MNTVGYRCANFTEVGVLGEWSDLENSRLLQTNTSIGTLAVDGWVVTFETGSGWGLGGPRHCVEVMK